MTNNHFNHLVPEMSKMLAETFMDALSVKKEFRAHVDTSPLLNMTIATFISSLTHILDTIKRCTDGEEKLIANIELAKNSLIKAIEDLPFISEIQFI